MTAEPAYDAFLSYNSLDHALVERIAKELGTRQCRCFVDRWYLQPGRDWVEALEQALGSSHAVVMFVGPNEMGRWQQRERAWALDRLAGAKNFPVIPVLLPSCQPPLGFMKQLMWVDLRDDPGNKEQLDFLAAAIRGETIDRSGKTEPRATICPFRGLLPFREEDAEFFFGRQAYTDKLVSLVKQHPLVAVVGASGSGKSSVVRAGLVSQLRHPADGTVWDILTMIPKDNPLHSLADVFLPLVEPDLSGIDLIRKRKALAEDLEHCRVPLWDLAVEGLRQQKGTQRLLLVVDQWEEIYTNCRSETQRNRFIEELLDATARTESPLSVVFTVRWDFYGEILRNRKLLDRLESSRLDLGPMNRDELRSVIEEPAAKVGLTFQDGLVERILDDAGDEPGSLPLLEFVLGELWAKRRGDGQLTHEAYAALGRITGAIAIRAETIFDQLNPEEQQAAEILFRRLVQAGAKTAEDTRRRADLQSLDETTQQVARKLANERLLVTTGVVTAKTASDGGHNGGTSASPQVEVRQETVEVAHEELLRRWDRLKRWIDADRRFLQWRSRLVPLLAEFERDPKSALLRGNALRESHQFVPLRAGELEQTERRFVVASQSADRRRKIYAGISGLVFLSGVLVIWSAVRQSTRTQESKSMVESLLATSPSTVDFYLPKLAPFGGIAQEQLRNEFSSPERQTQSGQRVRAVYGLIQLNGLGNAPLESAEVQFLLDNVAKLPKEEGPNILAALATLQPADSSGILELLTRRLDGAAADDPLRNRWLAISAGLKVPGPLAPVCLPQANPWQRTSFIHAFSEFPGDLLRVAELLKDQELDPDIRSALCIAIGTMKAEAVPATQDVLKELYRSAPDGGTHSAARWALLQQGVSEDDLEKLVKPQAEPNTQPGWESLRLTSEATPATFVGLTMVKVPENEFAIGSVTDDVGGGEDSGWTGDPAVSDQPEHFPAIWVSDREITVGQFKLLLPQFQDTVIQNAAKVSDAERLPAREVSWYDAIEFCNALSETQQLKPYYKLVSVERDEAKRIRSADVQPDPEGQQGYRLLTEKEWEYACRAMSTQGYCFGDDAGRLPEYGVYNESDPRICGQRIPNAFGLFDMHGNVWEWCWDNGDDSGDSRVLRGGSFDLNNPQYLRSANRNYDDSPEFRYLNDGFRISRTP